MSKEGFSVSAVSAKPFPGTRWRVTAPDGFAYESSGAFYDSATETAQDVAVRAGWRAVKSGSYAKAVRYGARRNPSAAEHAERAKKDGRILGELLAVTETALQRGETRAYLLDHYGSIRSAMGRLRSDAADGGLRYEEVPNWSRGADVLRRLREKLSHPRENPRRNPTVKARLVWDDFTAKAKGQKHASTDRGWASLARHPDARGADDLWANESRTVGNYLDYGPGSPGQARGKAGNVMASAYLTRIDPSTRVRHEHRLGSEWFKSVPEAKAWIARKVWAALRGAR